MLKILKNVLGKKDKASRQDQDDLLNADVAICALLLEAAHADGECSEEEKQRLVAMLAEHADIPLVEVEQLIDEGYQAREEAIDILTFTRYMNNNFAKDQKLQVMESVWRIIHADEFLEAHEDQFAHKLANLLRLTHKEMIECKIRARS